MEKKRKTRVTKKAIRAARKELKKTSYQRKKTVKPGPYTELDTTGVDIKPRLKKNSSMFFKEPVYGNYQSTSDWNEKGWYPIVINIEATSIAKKVDEYGMDKFLAAVEKMLSEETDKKGRSKYGTIVILEMAVDHSQDEKKFISLRAKTNKKNISGFVAVRSGVYQRLE